MFVKKRQMDNYRVLETNYNGEVVKVKYTLLSLNNRALSEEKHSEKYDAVQSFIQEYPKMHSDLSMLYDAQTFELEGARYELKAMKKENGLISDFLNKLTMIRNREVKLSTANMIVLSIANILLVLILFIILILK